MSKFVIVKAAPKELPPHTIVVQAPPFKDAVVKTIGSLGRQKITTANYLRVVADALIRPFDRTFNAFRNIRPYEFEGRQFTDADDLAAVVREMVTKQYPAIYEKFVTHELANRPHGTKLVYFVGDFHHAGAFFKAGIDEVKEKDVDVYLGLKPKKVVGKPAVTDSETTEKKAKPGPKKATKSPTEQTS